MNDSPSDSQDTVLSAAAARRSASLMDWGNIVAIILPVPLLIFWFGASIVVFAINRHHPNPKVGHYTQQAAYRLYGITGFFVIVALFFPGDDWSYYLYSWLLAVAILIPWSLLSLWRIRRDHWESVVVNADT
ncbi:MAG: hypothetical protein ACFCBW_04075 [Candidatus Competibacterales bacterium]